MSETNKNATTPVARGAWSWQSDLRQRIIIAIIAVLVSSMVTNGIWAFTINHRLSVIEDDIRELRGAMIQHLNRGD